MTLMPQMMRSLRGDEEGEKADQNNRQQSREARAEMH